MLFRSVLLPDDLAPGTYTLTTGMYRLNDGTRLTVERAGAAAGDVIVLETIEVE